MLPFARVSIIGLGLIGSSVARAVKANMPDVRVTGYDADESVRERARAIGLCDDVTDLPGTAVIDAGLVLLCVPVGAMGEVAAEFAADLPADAIISDVGSCKQSVAEALARALPGAMIIPAHPVAGTEKSGPDAGFATLFKGRWCILTPPEHAPEAAVAALSSFWQRLGADIEIMDARHHDLVLAITSHLPHLIAYTIVGTADDLGEVTQSEVIKYSAGGFRDFTRIAASDPVMWRDVFLNNKEAVLEMLQRFSEDLFSRTRDIRRSIVEQGQDDDVPDFGRKH
jgi:cyclohexadieny/prephenate dehydrogenase